MTTAGARPGGTLPKLSILDGTTQPQHRPFPSKLSLAVYEGRGAGREVLSAGADELRSLALERGADDVGFVSLDREDLASQRAEIEALLLGARTAIAFVVQMQRGNVRTPARSVANNEFHHATDATNEVGRALAHELEARGHRAVSPPGGFPMEMDRFPGKIWTLSVKPIAVAAGLGQMGIHRNLIHPRFGNFVLIGVVLTDLAITRAAETKPIDWNPCIGCRLCVAACPVGAVKPDGKFDFVACSTHNYREFLGGFSDWAEQVVESADRATYRRKVVLSETVSMWQSLSFGANYKAAYCMAVCPAGTEVIGPYRVDKARYLDEVVRPLTDKVEPIYVVPGSDAEAHVRAHFPHKQPRPVGSGLYPGSIEDFIASAPLVFASGAAKDVAFRAAFAFRGSSRLAVTFTIDRCKLQIEEGHVAEADLKVDADADTWLGIVRGEKNPVWAVLTRRLRVKGPLRLLETFQRCFAI